MFAINHAATALLVKRRYPAVAIAPLLISVQAMELAWVVLNYLGVERTTTEPVVRSVADMHLVYMPYSHSVGTALGVALLTLLIIEKGFGRVALGRAIGLGIASHLILDLLTHGHDIVLWPGQPYPRLGLGVYANAPLAAFVVEASMASSAGACIQAAAGCWHSSSSPTWRTSRCCRPRFPAPSTIWPDAPCSPSRSSSCRSSSRWCWSGF